MKLKIINESLITQEFETNSSQSEWFGYYNYDPLCLDRSKILCNRSPIDAVAPKQGVSIDLGYYDVEKCEWHKIGQSDSWNWQQGSMMQWIPSNNSSETKIIYNFSSEGKLKSKIYELGTGNSKEIDWPIYGITPDGTKSIAIDLERSYWCRAYHYQSVANQLKEGMVYEDDGIFEIDLENNIKRRIISITDIINEDYRPYFKEKKHWVEHIMISPSGKRFCFLHRFSSPDNVARYQTRLFIANIDGSGMRVVPDWELYDMSHFGWASDHSFAIYSYKINERIPGLKALLKSSLLNIKSIFKRLLLSLNARIHIRGIDVLCGIHNSYRFYQIDDNGDIQFIKDFSNRYFDIDGHPSFTKDGKYMITDTYPDRKSYRNLIVYNTNNNKHLVLAKLYAGLRGNPATCDLHPKLSRDNEHVMTDSAYDGKHHLILFKLKWDEIKKRIN